MTLPAPRGRQHKIENKRQPTVVYSETAALLSRISLLLRLGQTDLIHHDSFGFHRFRKISATIYTKSTFSDKD
jgi:hypothetical protein